MAEGQQLLSVAFFFFPIAFMGCVLLPAYGQMNQLTVHVEHDEYAIGDSIVITGRLDATGIDQPLLLEVFDPDGSRDRVDQIELAADGEYRYTFTVGGLMNTIGTYSVQVSYKGSVTAKITFVLDYAERQDGVFRLVIDGQEYFIQYLLTGQDNKIQDITVDSSRNSTFPGAAFLYVTLSAKSDGTLSLRFPTSFFDANEEFLAFTDDAQVEVLDESYGEMNVISIDFQAGTRQIIITGDQIIPEFHSVATIITAVSIFSVILAHRYVKRKN